MHRIAPQDNTRPTHDVEVGFLNDIIIDAKLRARGLSDPARVVDHAYLHHWGEYYKQIVTCRNIEARYQQWERQRGSDKEFIEFLHKPVHEEAAKWLNEFMTGYHEIIDGKRKITPDEIRLYEKYADEIRACQTQLIYY